MIREMTLEDFYNKISTKIPDGISKEIGHFNVFEYEKLFDKLSGKHVMPYSKRDYYKISLIKGKNKAEYADKVIELDGSVLLFATPKIPYHWTPQSTEQSGHFCVFTHEFLTKSNVGLLLDDLPIFNPGSVPIFHLSEKDTIEIEYIFSKMQREISSEYIYKYDLIRNLVLELVHFGQKLQPATALYSSKKASERITSLFVELLERQFPIESPQQRLVLRTAKDYADRLAVHVNHLNKVLKEHTGKTTTEIINGRIVQEAKILLKQTNWNISEISNSLGFEEVAHFSNFFKKRTSLTPLSLRK